MVRAAMRMSFGDAERTAFARRQVCPRVRKGKAAPARPLTRLSPRACASELRA